MSNPYHPPKSKSLESSEQQPPGFWVIVLSVALTIISGMLYSAIYPAVPQFVEIFEGFGAELPWFTQFILDNYYYFGLPYLLGLIPCMILVKNRASVIPSEKHLFMLIVINFVLSFFVIGITVIAMYLPIFKMGNVV